MSSCQENLKTPNSSKPHLNIRKKKIREYLPSGDHAKHVSAEQNKIYTFYWAISLQTLNSSKTGVSTASLGSLCQVILKVSFLLFRENLWKEGDAPSLEIFKHPVLQFVPTAPCSVNSRGFNIPQWTKKKINLSFCFSHKQKPMAHGHSWKYHFVQFREKQTQVQLKHPQHCQPLAAAVWHWTDFPLQRCEILSSVHSKCIFLPELNLQVHKSQEQLPCESLILGSE